jgi:hypothetical protein
MSGGRKPSTQSSPSRLVRLFPADGLMPWTHELPHFNPPHPGYTPGLLQNALPPEDFQDQQPGYAGETGVGLHPRRHFLWHALTQQPDRWTRPLSKSSPNSDAYLIAEAINNFLQGRGIR